jgi:hypothetical protein
VQSQTRLHLPGHVPVNGSNICFMVRMHLQANGLFGSVALVGSVPVPQYWQPVAVLYVDTLLIGSQNWSMGTPVLSGSGAEWRK